MKNQVNARISIATRTKLDALTAIYGTQAEVLAVALDRLWSSHFESRGVEQDDGYEELQESYKAFLEEEKKL